MTFILKKSRLQYLNFGVVFSEEEIEVWSNGWMPDAEDWQIMIINGEIVIIKVMYNILVKSKTVSQFS